MENLMKKVKIFSGKVKAASNVATVAFLTAIAYSISRWHKASGFDNFINVVIALMMLFINIRLYKMHLDLSDIDESGEDSRIQRIYKHQKREYSQLITTSLIIVAVFVLLKLVLS